MIPIVLKVYEAGKLKTSRAFRAERIRLGSAAADLPLEGEGILPSHALIEAGAHGAVLRATGTAPLFLNGQPILAAPLRHGDLISIGELRVMVELARAATPEPVAPKRPAFTVIEGGEELHALHAVAPALHVVPEQPDLRVHTSDQGANAALAEAPRIEAVPARPEPRAPAAMPAVRTVPPLPRTAPVGGECAEVELFWGDTRVSVWQLFPGEQFTAGTQPGCDALLQGLDKVQVVKGDVNGWTLFAPRPLHVVIEEEGRSIGGPELLVRGRGQADANGLVVPLQPHTVGMLQSGALTLRVRRVPGAVRLGAEPADYKGVLAASAAALFMMIALHVWSGSVPPARSVGEPEMIQPHYVAVRTPLKADPVRPAEKSPARNEARRDPGVAVARHQGEEGMAGSRNAPRREGRAQRKMDDRAVVAQTGLLKALGGGKGANDVFGVALEKGARDAMGHLTGPRVADARGDGGMGLKSLGGRGGGGDGTGLGLARIGTNGIGGGLANYGDGKGGLRGKEDGEIGLGPGKPEVVGEIDPELIRKVVHDHRAQIRTCYETQLNSKPTLAGKVVAAWTIDAAGSVTETHTQESTMHDRAVETCVNAKIKTWRFPIPKGGGEVFVTFPFIFTPGG